jgi:hypothetical protein
MTTDKKRVTVVLNQDVYDKLSNIAEVETRSITSLVTHVLVKFIKEYEDEKTS